MVAPKACHNCRSRRLRCDRSVPTCHKCTSTGQECLGYGTLYKWVDNKTSRDRTSSKPSVHSASKHREHVTFQPHNPVYVDKRLVPFENTKASLSPDFALLDPLFQDLSLSSRHYLHYYTTRFCQDLIIYDSPRRGANPFRDLIPISQKYPFLREIIVAASALHFCNAARWHKCPRPAAESFVDALRARHRAIKSLQDVIEHYKVQDDVENDDAGRDALLAAVLFFVNFSLIDSGKGGWRAHMNFVGTLLRMRTSNISGQAQIKPRPEEDPTFSLDFTAHDALLSLPFTRRPAAPSQSLSVGDYIASDSVAYYIWSNALDSLVLSSNKLIAAPPAFDEDGIVLYNILVRTEANSYHSCPSILLYAIYRTSQLARDIRSNESSVLNDKQIETCRSLLHDIEAFDSDAWAARVSAQIVAITGHADEIELRYRRHIAGTYRAAIFLYILLVAPELPRQVACHEDKDFPALPSTADLAATILHHLSFVPTDSPLFKFATWPIFLTGVETADESRRTWVIDRLRDMRDLCPWGMLTSTMETLVEIWRMRDSSLATEESEADERSPGGRMSTDTSDQKVKSHWLMQLQGFKIDCLIV
ncbi:fungal-specific transcription factor domain-containing protein [Daldinia caldariorum]|uniref:fungal-specific transcription factor domain-containing protein n=1 Tax=Daldinia caldariorum TaxID=326644 RepID=UPI00200728E5|nr:fungal-specific transcription factor domain-containing protein [Daldinia caldariorum]KAI1468321.1 fungal-specific transcription factor domain-containing protein [Daldinia caldariorum]